MEVLNQSIVQELSAPDTGTQIAALTQLVKESNSGLDISNFVPLIITDVFSQSGHKTVKKLCYLIVQGTSLSETEWDSVVRVITSDLKNSTNSREMEAGTWYELSLHAIRTLITAPPSRLRSFIVSQRNLIESCISTAPDWRLRCAALQLLQHFHSTSVLSSTLSTASSLASSSAMSMSESYVVPERFGDSVVHALRDESPSVTAEAFRLLDSLIGSNTKAYFHQQRLPIIISRTGSAWVDHVEKEIGLSELCTRAKCLDFRLRYHALRPLTCCLLKLRERKHKTIEEQAYVDNICRPLLWSGHHAGVVEAGHCMLLIHYRQDAVAVREVINAYMQLLEIEECRPAFPDILKDICAVIYNLIDNYVLCIDLLRHIAKIPAGPIRVHVLSVIIQNIVEGSVLRREAAELSGENSDIYGSDLTATSLSLIAADNSEIDFLFRQPFFKSIWLSPKTHNDDALRREIAVLMLDEILRLCPKEMESSPQHNETSLSTANRSYSQRQHTSQRRHQLARMYAWASVAADVCAHCVSVLGWDQENPSTGSTTISDSASTSQQWEDNNGPSSVPMTTATDDEHRPPTSVGPAYLGRGITALAVTMEELADRYSPLPSNLQLQRKRLEKILTDLLQLYPFVKTTFGKIVSITVLANFLSPKVSISGRLSGDMVYDHIAVFTSSFIGTRMGMEKGEFSPESQTVDYLLYALLSICFRHPSKMKDAHIMIDKIKKNNPRLSFLILKKLESAQRKVGYVDHSRDDEDVLAPFYGDFTDEHPLFTSYMGIIDERFLLSIIHGKQVEKSIQSNLSPFLTRIGGSLVALVAAASFSALPNIVFEDTDKLSHILQRNNGVITSDASSSGMNDMNSDFEGRVRDREGKGTTTGMSGIDAYQAYMLQLSQASSHMNGGGREEVLKHTETVSRSSDPIQIHMSYLMYPDDHRLILRVSLSNATADLAIRNLRIHLAANGSMVEFGDSSLPSEGVDLSIGERFDATVEYSLRKWDIFSFHAVATADASSSGAIGGDDDVFEDDNAEEELITVRSRELGVRTRDLLRPADMLSVDHFLQSWAIFRSSFHVRTEIPLRDAATSISRVMRTRPFFLVERLHFTENNVFEICYASRTVFGDMILLVIFGVLDHVRHLCICDWEFRGASEDVIGVLAPRKESWFRELTGDAFSIVADDGVVSDVMYRTDSGIDLSIPDRFALEEDEWEELVLRKWLTVRGETTPAERNRDGDGDTNPYDKQSSHTSPSLLLSPSGSEEAEVSQMSFI